MTGSRSAAILALAAGLSLPAAGPVHFDRQQVAPRLTNLSGVSGSGPDDVFAVGARGTIVHFDGARWSSRESGTSQNLTAVWVASPTDVVAVGFGGTILRYDGRLWSRQASGTNLALSSVWGASSTEVRAVGRTGTILRFDGTSWRSEASGTREDLLTVWGSSASDVYAAGARGTLLHFNGSSWKRIDPGADWKWQFNALGGTSSTDVYAAGWRGEVATVDESRTGVFLHHDGRSWTRISGANDSLISSLWAVSPTEVFVTGTTLNGLHVLRHYDGRRLTTLTSDRLFEMRKVWVAPTGEVLVAAKGGTVFRGVPDAP